eukprot:TRINITY_DN6996_c0_g1_i1.p1 TRINITY_DN6996_c0_g1~~TRINITY_DN6996_c0_g1_i1.p1  ORF type:complete len:130 (-),score=39.71 TRINITY_DN6996_c0_g1_i1:66-455(-)
MTESTAHSSSSASAAPPPPATISTTSGAASAGKATVNWKRLQTKTRIVTALAPVRPAIPAGQVRKAKIAYSALFIFMLMAWSAILIGSVFALRENYYDCEACSRPGLCRSTTPAWGGGAVAECLAVGYL